MRNKYLKEHPEFTNDSKRPILIGNRTYVYDTKNKKTPFYYSDSIQREREFVRIRDNHTCQECGLKWIDGQKRLDVHHIEEEMYGKSNDRMIHIYDRHNKDKLITLCHRCHIRLHARIRKSRNLTL